MDNSRGNKRIAKNTIALYIRTGITMLISFFTTRVTLEILGVEDYGLNNVVASVVSLFSFINGSMGTAVQRFFSVEIGKKCEENLSRVFGTAIYLHIIVAIITLFIAEVFAIFFLHKLNIPPERLFAAKVVFQISIASMMLNILNVPYLAVLKAREEFSKMAILDIIQAFLRLGVLYLLYIINYDKLILLSTFYFGITLFYFFALKFIAAKYKETKFHIRHDKEYINKMVGFMSLLIFTVLSSLINKQGIVVLVNLFYGLTINAAYAIAFQVSTMIEIFAMNFKQSVVPQLMQAYGANNIPRMHALITTGTKITFLLLVLISLPIAFEIDYILQVWLKSPPEFSSTFIILLIIKTNIDVFYYFLYQGVHASGNIKKQQNYFSLSYLLSIAFIYIAFKLGGNFYYAVYIPILFSVVRNLISMFVVRGTIKFSLKPYITQVILPAIILVILLVGVNLAVLSLMATSFVRLLVVFILNALLVIFFGYYVFFNKTEQNSVINMIKGVKKQKI